MRNAPWASEACPSIWNLTAVAFAKASAQLETFCAAGVHVGWLNLLKSRSTKVGVAVLVSLAEQEALPVPSASIVNVTSLSDVYVAQRPSAEVMSRGPVLHLQG